MISGGYILNGVSLPATGTDYCVGLLLGLGSDKGGGGDCLLMVMVVVVMLLVWWYIRLLFVCLAKTR